MTADSSPTPDAASGTPATAAPSVAQDAALALVFLTRIPLPLRGPLADGAAARAIAWFPAVGALVGLAGGAAYALAGLLSLPPSVAALLALAAMVWLTGGLHEDGAADVADGFGGGRSTARKLEIMRDSRVGSYGVLALLLSLSLRAAAVAALAEPGAVAAALIAAGALSRAALAPMARLMPPARRDGLGAAQGRPPARTVALALLLGLLPAVGAAGWAGLAAAAAAGTAALLVGRSAIRQIGGQTGDVYGAAQQLGEVAVLLTLVALR